MKIVYLSDSMIPSRMANSVHVMKMCAAFATNGHDVVLHCYRDSSNKADPFRFYDVPESFEIENILTSRVPGARRVMRMYSARALVSRLSDVDLIYGRDLYGMVAIKGASRSMIFEAHSPPESAFERVLLGRLIRTPELRRLVVISEALRAEFHRIYPQLEPSKVLVAHDGADIPSANSKKTNHEWPGRPGVIQCGYVGSLLPGKGAETVAALAARLSEFDFHIIGGSTDQVAELRARFNSSNLYLHGHVPHSSVPWHLNQLDIALFPMQDKVITSDGRDIARWTSPLKLFEYMACKRSIIASDLPAISEIVENGKHALLIRPTDLNAWSKAIIRMAMDPSIREQMARTGYCHFCTHFTWKKRAEMILRFAGSERPDNP
jgi:glycosyltransferase involved in cell wall biosynthesis